MLHFFTIGSVLGLSAGFAPGPLLALVISETLHHDIKAGIKVAAAPIFTDLPIILIAILVISQVAESDIILSCISFCGALFLVKMGLENIMLKGVPGGDGLRHQHSLGKGILTNFLSPHPYLFWLTIGVPIMSKAIRHDHFMVAAFLFSFYLFLVGSKIGLALLVGRSKTFLSGKLYLFIMKLLGAVLMLLAVFLCYDGIMFLF